MFNVFLFIRILSLGLAVPSTLLILFNLSIRASHGDKYEVDINKMMVMYIICLVSWSLCFSVKL